jgi:osmotically inducible protein OsmC
MSTRTSQAVWEGKLKSGQGFVKLGSGNFECAYTFSSRFEEGQGTNPEELIGAALAGCFSMALAHGLEEKGFTPERIDTTAKASIEKKEAGFSITQIDLETAATVPDIDEATFKEQVDAAKTDCPVSQALAGTQINVRSELTAGETVAGK